MAQVALEINGRRFEVACDDGQEEHVRRLGAFVDDKVRTLADSVGQVGEHRLLVMASLLLADALDEATGGRMTAAGDKGMQQPSPQHHTESARERAAAETLERVAERLEHIAARLERP